MTTSLRNNVIVPIQHAVRALPEQLRTNVRWYGVVLGALILMGAIVLYIHCTTHIPVTRLFEDPVDFARLPLYVGIYTWVGASAMLVAGSVLLFAAWAALCISRSMRRFAVTLGAFLLWLGLDDVFMIHEFIGLRLAQMIQSENVPEDRQWLEAYVFIAYAIIWVVMVLVFARQLLNTAWILLGLTFVGFGVSVVLDLHKFLHFLPGPTTAPMRMVLNVGEDMAKLAGNFFALAFAIHCGRAAVRGEYARDFTESIVES